MLRDPVARAYSHYWHSVSTGRATLPFARQVTERPGNLVRRGEYAPQLRRWLKHFDRDRLLAVFFEDFVRDPQNTVDRCMRFLGIDTMIDVSTIDSHRNPSWPPLSLRGRLALNAAMPWLMRKRYRGFLPEPAAGRVTRRERQLLPARVAEPLQSAVNALRPRKRFPPMDDASRQALSEHFARVNAGLDELVGRDLSEIWPSAR
jgi:hypothetical protein